MKPFIIIIIVCFFVTLLRSQDTLKQLEHTDFLIWKTIQDPQLSADGIHATYRLVPGEGDPSLIIYDMQDSSTYTLPRVSKSTIDRNGGFVFGMITPHRDSLRLLERKKIEKKDWPSDTLFIVNLADQRAMYVPHVTNYKSPEKTGDWIAYTVKSDAFPTDTAKKEKKGKKDIVHLIIRQLSTGQQDTLKYVKEFNWSSKSPVLAAIVDSQDSLIKSGVYYFKDHAWHIIKKEKGEYAKPSVSPLGNKMAFIANHDTTDAQVPPWKLQYFDFTTDSAYLIATPDSSLLPLISHHADLRWSDDDKYLFYGRAQMPIVKDTSLLEDETVQVEIWRTEDPVLYTVQNVNKPEDEKKAYHFAFDTQSKKHVGIHSPDWESVSFTRERNNRFVLVYTDKPYQLGITWLGDAAKDLAIADLQTGKITPFKKEIITSPRLSPSGKYAYGYSEADTTWWTYHIVTGVFSLMNTRGLPTFYNEFHDLPGLPNSYGAAGWTDDDESLIIYDRYDIWKWSPLKGKIPVRVTNGRSANLIYRYVHTDDEKDALPIQQPWLIHVTDDISKSSGYTWYSPVSNETVRPDLIPFQYTRQVRKAKDADVYLFRKENFQTFPDLEITSDKFASSLKISDANPQKANYKWGTIELHEWMDWDSVVRRGLLVKPYGFDSLRSYPMIVNFYERYTDALHNHPNIEPHRSTINYALYASRGYAIFNPDISYEVGLPGESAYKIVMSGVESLVRKRVADPNRLALQGHSWGGYQIAYIVTRTDIFKCAEAGASVVNMTSAYGGIRWGTGLSRMFQYERAQSRLGKSLWEDPQLYITNSPLFKINKINTPLLLMHNDEDGAVPFEQGIEFYLALRRLGKKAWLLNYTGEPHWPVKWQNRKDFQLRMSQFFDHYLKGAPMPRWMESGVPALKKGIDRGY